MIIDGPALGGGCELKRILTVSKFQYEEKLSDNENYKKYFKIL
jgi:hypothetical protein